jgi:endoglucanase
MAYRQWLDKIVGSIQGPTVVIVEPDAIADLVHGGCLKGEQIEERYGLLNDAIGAFKSQKHVVAVYLDAANPRWFADPSLLVEPLHRAGVHGADGISTNVSNFVGTQENLAWIEQLMSGLGRFGNSLGAVIDTSRNGNGPYESTLEKAWCNPPGRALGDVPTTKVGTSLHVHAKLWIKIPGASDGACREGQPVAGEFWLDYALGLARGDSP